MGMVTEFIDAAKSTGMYSFDTEYHPGSSFYRPDFRVLGCSFASGDMAFYLRDMDQIKFVFDELFPLDIDAVAHNGKSDIQSLVASKIVPFGQYPSHFVDTMVAENLIDENIKPKDLGLKRIVHARFGHQMQTFDEAWAFGPDSHEFAGYGADDAKWELALWQAQKPELEQQNLMKLFRTILMPASHLFADAELFGMKWDTEYAHELLKDFTNERDRLEKEIYCEIGYLNINSPLQLAKRFFDDLGWSDAGIQKTEKTGRRQLDEDALDTLGKKYEVCAKILRLRKLTKLIGTYVLPLSQKSINDPYRRIHPSFWIVSTTGRTRCEDPNLQNVPARTVDGRKIRQCFIAEEGWKLLICDYSQIELRLIALISGDPVMQHAYLKWQCKSCNQEGKSATILHSCPNCGAAETEDILTGGTEGFWHGIDLHQITADAVGPFRGNRSLGKTGNFAMCYGITARTLLERFGQLTLTEWDKALADYFKQYAGVRKWHLLSENDLYSRGIVKDLFGRKRRIPDFMRRSKRALNMFVNFAPQASACELSQLCMSKLRKRWIDAGVWGEEIRIVNFVHDECVFEVREDAVDRYKPEIIEVMETSVNFGIPIRLDTKLSDHWNVK